MSCSVAVVMAGGAGSRLGYAIKPALELCGKPMVTYVAETCAQLCKHVVLLVSWRTRGAMRSVCSSSPLLDCVETSGYGYSEDLGFALKFIRERPLLVVPSDTPFVSRESLEFLLSLALEECDQSVATLSVECRDFIGISVFRADNGGWCTICIPRSIEFLNVNTSRDLELARGICSEDPWRGSRRLSRL